MLETVRINIYDQKRKNSFVNAYHKYYTHKCDNEEFAQKYQTMNENEKMSIANRTIRRLENFEVYDYYYPWELKYGMLAKMHGNFDEVSIRLRMCKLLDSYRFESISFEQFFQLIHNQVKSVSLFFLDSNLQCDLCTHDNIVAEFFKCNNYINISNYNHNQPKV